MFERNPSLALRALMGDFRDSTAVFIVKAISDEHLAYEASVGAVECDA
jgi:hypothetical protein